jgi:hypothetical protein
VRAKEVAAFGQEILDSLRMVQPTSDGGYRDAGGLSAVVEAADKATYYGVELFWNHWGVRPGESLPVPMALEQIDERRLACDLNTQSLLLGEGYGGGTPISEYPAALTTEVRNTRISQQIAQAGAGRAILIPWALRFASLKDLMTYLEVWGVPTVIGKMSDKVTAGFSEDELERLQRMIDDMAGDSRIVLPPGFDVATVSAVSGGERVHEFLDTLTERAIQFAIVGQTGTSAANNTNRASAEVSERILDVLIDGDARMVGGALERLLSHAVAIWFGQGTPAPQVTFPTDDTDLRLAKLDYYAAISKAGLPVTLEETLRAIGLQEPAHGSVLFDGLIWDADKKKKVASLE